MSEPEKAAAFDLVATGIIFIRKTPTSDGRQVDEVEVRGRDQCIYDRGEDGLPRLAGFITHTRWLGDRLWALAVFASDDLEVDSTFALTVDCVFEDPLSAATMADGVLRLSKGTIVGAHINTVENSVWPGEAQMVVVSKLGVTTCED